jgi:hypothetical protein
MLPAMNRTAALIVSLLVAGSVTGCVTGGDGWQRTDGKPYSVNDSSQCRGEAQAQTRSQYPDQIVQAGGAEITVPNPDRGAAEQAYYDRCMQRLGYRRGPPPPA